MQMIDAPAVIEALGWRPLIEALRDAFRAPCRMPPRHHHTIDCPGEPAQTLLVMPAWQEGGAIGIKLVTVAPGNAGRGLPAVSASYVLADGRTGRHLALIDGGELTVRRTAAASALAADYLARADARHLLMVGTGRLAPNLIAAHATVRPIDRVTIWGRSPHKAAALAARLNRPGLAVAATGDLPAAVAAADIVSCATLATEALVRGDWLPPGVHLDLVGAFTPTMREADDAALTRGRVFVDTRDGALTEAGEIVQAIQAGVLAADDIAADLFELTGGHRPGRTGAGEITVFKSAGTALEDLAAAMLVVQAAGGPPRSLPDA